MTQSFQELLTTNYGLLPSGYTGSQGAMGYTGSAGSSGGGGGGPKITNIQATNSSYTVLDDTAIDIAGGYVKLTGTGFESGCIVMVNNIPATSTTFVSSTEVRAQLPATAAGTYVVYLVNTDGGVAIRINGVTFSTTPTWTTASILAESPDSVAVSIQLAATGASTYSLAAGSTLPGTLTVSSSGLISGMLPALESLTTYSFTVLATDAELQDSPRTFSITITTGDPFFNSTTLLLPGTANTFVKDASANNLTATVVGNAKPSTFNPYLTGWSNFFDGTGDYLRVPSTGAGFSSITTFTYECWIQPTSALGTNCIFDISESQPFRFVLSGSNVTWQASGSGTTILTATFTWVIGAWHHVAFVRDSSNNISIFINGTRYATANYGGSWGATQAGGVNIGCNRGDTWFFPGYISNARFVKGTAIYDPTQTTISVPTTPLTAVAGTSLLTCADNRFIDDSVDNLAVTVNGDVKVQSFSPFVEPATTGGSAYFAGGTSYVTVPVAASTGDLTIECWIYPTAYTSPRGFVLTSGGNDSTAWAVSYGTTGVLSLWVGSYSNPSVASPNTIPLNTWGHIAIVKTAGTVYMYTNGVRSTGAGQAGTFGSTTNVHIATYNETPNTQSFAGYVSNFRYVNGTALYTGATATPPASPLTAVTGTRFLTLQNNTPVDNSTFLDASSNNLLVTRAGNTTQGTFSPYSPSGWSNYFDGTGDYLTIPYNLNIDLIPGSWTFECWVFPTATKSAMRIFSTGGGTVGWNSTTGIHIMIGLTSANLLGAQVATGTSSPTVVNNPTTVSLNTWNHIAVCVDTTNSKLRVFLNGVMAEGTYTTYSRPSTNPVATIGTINGEAGDVNTAYQGNISNLRIVKGTAIYTANFTPSTQPLTAVAGTSLLTCADNRFIDESANNFAITRNGDTRITNFSPFKAQVQTPTTYSAYFDGTGDYIRTTGLVLNNSAFTISFYFYPTTSNVIGLFDSGPGQPSCFRNFPANTIGDQDGGSVAFTPLVNQWNWMSIVGNGTNFTVYLNGSSVGSAAYASLVDSNFTIGTINSGGDGAYTGYISNFRIKNIAAVDSVPTTPLAAITNTTFLTCQSATFVDNSTNRFAITAAGNSQPTTVNPFGSTFANSTGYTAAQFGGSMYFDGSGDYLDLPNNTAFSQVGSWTLELWVYPTAAQNNYVYSQVTTNFLQININGSMSVLVDRSGVGTSITSTSPILLNVWTHLALVSDGTNMKLFVNGTQSGSTAAVGTQAASATTTRIGAYQGTGGLGYAGYISDFKLVKSQALYTSNFVPPIAPVLPVQNTTLLLNGTSAGITDATTRNNLETVGDVKVSTAVSKWGGSSMFFDGTGDYLEVKPINSSFAFGTGNFTIEGWYYSLAYGGNYALVGKGPSDSDDELFILLNGGQYYIDWGPSSGAFMQGGSWSANTWNHFALVRNGANLTMYHNGVSAAATSGIAATSFTDIHTLKIGVARSGTFPFNGYMQDFRVTKGVARYTANFTPPTAAVLAK